MDNVKALLELPSLKNYNIELLEEGIRKILMIAIFALIVFSFPYRPSSSKIYCVHGCVVNSSIYLKSAIAGNSYHCDCKLLNKTTGSPYQLNGTLYDESFLNEKSHECTSRHKVGSKYLAKAKENLGNIVCTLPEILHQMQVFGTLFIVYCIFLGIQIRWVCLVQNRIKKLLNIQNKLTENGSCRSCIKEFILNGKQNTCKSCDQNKLRELLKGINQKCDAGVQTGGDEICPQVDQEGQQCQPVVQETQQQGQADANPRVESTEPLKRKLFNDLENDQKKLKEIKEEYETQNSLNIGITIAISFALVIIRPNFRSQFECELHSVFSIEEDHPFLKTRYLTCLSPDATLLTFSMILIIFLNIALLVLFIINLFGREITKKLCDGVRYKEKAPSKN